MVYSALQQDISTVEKKVDSLIETCTLITNRAEESYAEQLRQSLDGLKKRWSGIIDSTEKQKENLRNAGEKFQQIDDGVKKIMESLGQIDSAISKEDFSVLRQDTLLSKKQEYQTYITRLEEHDQLLTSHTNTINALITTTSTTTTPPPTEQPPVCIEIEKTRTTITTLRGRIETNLSKLTSFNTDLEELKALLENVNKLAGQLKKEIVNLTSKQAGADEEILKECLSSIPAISEQIETGVFKQFDEMSTRVSKSNVCNQVILDMIYEYTNREWKASEKAVKRYNLYPKEASLDLPCTRVYLNVYRSLDHARM
ncbi:dystrophin-like [Clytia hemisphaerica]|uniref:dystrophin-like n=1 Tax=Clytia hemisphaerica TaxID=252671 RepID=UPI0034D5C743